MVLSTLNMRKFLQIILLGLTSVSSSIALAIDCPDIETQLKVEVQSDDIVKICNDQYIQYFSKEWKIPVAVVEKLEESDFKQNKAHRTNDFRFDSRLSYKDQLNPKQYAKSGYDKGHLAAQSDTSDYDTVSQQYLMTNIVPQDPVLNRTTWKNMETFAKDLRKSNYHAKYVISGIVFDNCEIHKTKNGMNIPDKMFKIIAHDRISTVFFIDNIKPEQNKIFNYESNLGIVNSQLCKVKIKFNPE